MEKRFNGFHDETIQFLSDLKDNNSKEWFDENRERYDKYITEPSRKFVVSMGERLKEISPDIHAEPKVNKSLFRMNRDIRFSPDKSPYKTNLGIVFWEGPRKRMECPGFYFHLESDSLMLAGGMHILPKDLLDPYRKIVSEEGPAGELNKILERARRNGIEVGGIQYKRIPRGFTVDHPNSYLLKHNGVYGMETTSIPDELFSEKLIDYSLERFTKIDPMNRWFLKYLF
jgi:uncharacterized protein (TIGR02453 family)